MASNQRNVLGEIALGAVAGAAATWLMGKATSYLYEHENETARQREDKARGGQSAYETAAEKVASLACQPLSDDERKKMGSAIHWSVGIGSSVLYALLRRRLSRQGVGRELAAGALFGTAVWLLLDEVGNVALGLTPGPRAFPWQTHARGLAGHLVLGLGAEGILQAANAAARRVA